MKKSLGIFFRRSLAAVAVAGVAAVAEARKLPPGCNAAVLGEKYWAQWNDDAEREITESIEANRKADGTFAIPDADGVRVSVELIRHDFRFGAIGNRIGTFGTPARNLAYETFFTNLFNQVTVPVSWRQFERFPGDGDYHTTYFGTEAAYARRLAMKLDERSAYLAGGRSLDQNIAFAKSNDLSIHLRSLVNGDAADGFPFWLYEQYCPAAEKRFLRYPLPERNSVQNDESDVAWLARLRERASSLYDEYTPLEIAAACPRYLRNLAEMQSRRIREIIGYCGTRVDSYDVVCSATADWVRSGRAAAHRQPLTECACGVLPRDYAKSAFDTAARLAPTNALLCIDDWNVFSADYPDAIDDFVSRGARIDIVGAQFAFDSDSKMRELASGGGDSLIASPNGIRTLFERLGSGGRKVHVSRVVLPSVGQSSEDRQRQAIVAYNLLRAWFAQPSAWGVTWGRTVDGANGDTAGLLDRNLRPKTVALAVDSLVNGEWRTRLTVPVKGGKVSFRGFRGVYRLSWRCSKCGESHDRLVELTGDGVAESALPHKVCGCFAPVRSFRVDGKMATLVGRESMLDLAKVYPNEIVRGSDGKRWAAVDFTLFAPSNGVYQLERMNDWYGEVSVNGGPVTRIDGPSDFRRRFEIELRRGENQIRYRTRAGKSGRWNIGIWIPGESGVKAL